jgi:hypothetical protein
VQLRVPTCHRDAANWAASHGVAIEAGRASRRGSVARTPARTPAHTLWSSDTKCIQAHAQDASEAIFVLATLPKQSRSRASH